jgi:hypothetical protein
MVKPINWGGMLEPYLQPLKERLGMLPLGQYEDGSVRLAWPGMLADTFSKGMAAADTPIPAINDDQAWADKSAAMFDMTSLAPMAGAGVAMTGALDNALGSAGGNLMKGATPDLPMDLASRMARAKEMGFDTDTPLYHGTRNDFDAFSIEPEPGRDIFGVHLGTKEQADDIVKSSGYYKRNVGDYWPESRILPVYAKQGNMLELPDLGQGNSWDVGALRYEMATRGIPFKGDDFNPTLADVRKSLQDAGYDGIKYLNEFEGTRDGSPQNSVMLFDPRNIRSVNAAFDPSKSDSANLLAANAPTGAAIPAGMEAAQGEQDPQTMTTANILRLLMGGK